MLLTTSIITKSIEAHLANGHLGVQGVASGIKGSRSFMTGIVDLTPNDTYRMANLPTWNRIDVRVGNVSVEDAFSSGNVSEYTQTLDTATGILYTDYVAEIGGIKLRVEVKLLLSMDDMNLAYHEIKITPSKECEIIANVGVYDTPSYPERFPWRSIIWPHEDFDRRFGQGFMDPRMSYAWHPGDTNVELTTASDDLSFAISASTPGYGPLVGVAMTTSSNCDKRKIVADEKNAGAELTFNATPLKPLVIENYIAFSRDDIAENLLKTAQNRAEKARESGTEKLVIANNTAWTELWKRDIIIEGDEVIAKQARADLYYLYSNGPKDSRYAYQAMGIASPGYFGGVFWDCDIYDCFAMLPFNDEYSLNTAKFRQRTLPIAMKRASEDGMKGAKFPVISDIFEGADNLVGHSELGAKEIHFGADAAMNCWHYYLSSGDKSMLRATLYPVMEQVADYFASRATWIPWENRYEILHVHSAQEAAGNVHNCLFTNAITKRLMEVTARAAEILGYSPDSKYRDIAEKLHIPTRKSTGLWQANSSNENPEETRFLETNAVLLAELPASEEQLHDIMTVPPHFWDMSYQATIAAMAKNPQKMQEYLTYQATNFSHEEFLLRTEMKENDAGPYLTGSAALLVNLLQGAGGLRYTESGLTKVYDTCLPTNIKSITFPNLKWQNKEYSVTIKGNETKIEPLL